MKLPEPFVTKSAEILPALWDCYGGYLRSEITGVRFVHNSQKCYLEITTSVERPHDTDERVERIDLTAITSDPANPMFSGHVSAFITASELVEHFNAYDLIMCTTLFTAHAAEFIDQ